MTKIEVSVVIGSYNQNKILRKVLDGFNKQITSVNFEVIVCDSGSNDGTHELFKNFKAKFKFIPIIKENQGKAAARNLAIKHVNSDITIITDSDMIPDTSFIESHFQAHKHSKHLACFEGVTYNLSHYHFPILLQNTFPYITNPPKRNKKIGFYYFLTGNLSIPTQILQEEIVFDESFSNYGWEDLELGYRMINQNKIPLYYLPEAKNYHYHVISKLEEIKRCKLKGVSSLIFLNKHPELRQFLGIHFFSKFCHSINIKFPNLLTYFLEKGLTSEKKIIRKFSFWYCKESFYWEALYSTKNH